MADDLAAEPKTGLRGHAGVAIGAAALLGAFALGLFTNLADERVGRLSERHVGQIVGTMVSTGDWLVPSLRGEARLERSPFVYWSGAATTTLRGAGGPFSLRLPSALASLALVALGMAWGASLGGPARGLASGAALACTYQLLASGRRGDSEVLLALLCTASLVAFSRLLEARSAARLAAFATLAGLALLAKPGSALLVVVLPIGAYLALERAGRMHRDPRFLGACAVALAIAASWYVLLLAQVSGAAGMIWRDVVLPLGLAPEDGASGARPVWHLLAALPLRAAPAGLLLPLVAWRLFATRLYAGDARMRLAALALVVPFVACSLLPEKRVHYTLLMLPSLAVLAAEAVHALAPRARAWLARGLGAPLALAGLAVTGLMALFFHWIEAEPAARIAARVAAPGALFAVALGAALRGRTAGFACAWVPAFLLAFALHRGAIVARAEHFQSDGGGNLTLDERERLYRVAREEGWFIELFPLVSPPEVVG